MKKLLSVLLVSLFVFVLVSCKVQTPVQTPVQKSTEALGDYIIQNGQYDEGRNTHFVVETLTEEDDTTAFITLNCDENKNIEVMYYQETKTPYALSETLDDYETSTSLYTLKLDGSSSNLPVMLYETMETPYVNTYFTGNSLSITATGEINPEKISISNETDIETVKFTYDSTLSSITDSFIEEQVDSLFPAGVDVTLTSFNLFLLKNTDITMEDLGFINYN